MGLSPTDQKAIDLQTREFDAMDRLAKQWERHRAASPRSGDYAKVRQDYESALTAFLKACHDNGRRLP